jgi:hypothetical protein
MQIDTMSEQAAHTYDVALALVARSAPSTFPSPRTSVSQIDKMSDQTARTHDTALALVLATRSAPWGVRFQESHLGKIAPEVLRIIIRYVISVRGSEAITPVIKSRQRRAWMIRLGLWDWGRDEENFYFDEIDEENNATKDTIDTSVMAVCKDLWNEASEVLYGTKILRGSVLNLDLILRNPNIHERARRIEITPCSYARASREKAAHFRDMLIRVQGLPRVQSILVLSDDLSRFDIPIMQFIQEVDLGPATCIDIGKYSLGPMFQNVQIVNRTLRDWWPSVRETPEGYDGLRDALDMIDALDTSEHVYNVPTWASHSSLRCWVDLNQQFVEAKRSGEWEELVEKAENETFDEATEDRSKYMVFRYTVGRAMRRPMYNYPLLRHGEYILRNLGPDDDPYVLDVVSEFLAVNIAGYHEESYHPHVHQHWQWRFAIVWGATWEDTGKTTLQYMVEQHNIALASGTSNEFILDSVIGNDTDACNLIDRRLAESWLSNFFGCAWLLFKDATSPTPDVLKRLSFLHIATTSAEENRGSEYHVRRNAWTRDLLRRYILASRCLSQNESAAVYRASTADLRTIVGTVLNVFDHRSKYSERMQFLEHFTRDDEPPLDFDTNVYAPLAWGYGKLFAQAFRRFGLEESLSMTLAQQWVKETTIWGP